MIDKLREHADKTLDFITVALNFSQKSFGVSLKLLPRGSHFFVLVDEPVMHLLAFGKLSAARFDLVFELPEVGADLSLPFLKPFDLVLLCRSHLVPLRELCVT